MFWSNFFNGFSNAFGGIGNVFGGFYNAFVGFPAPSPAPMYAYSPFHSFSSCNSLGHYDNHFSHRYSDFGCHFSSPDVYRTPGYEFSPRYADHYQQANHEYAEPVQFAEYAKKNYPQPPTYAVHPEQVAGYKEKNAQQPQPAAVAAAQPAVRVKGECLHPTYYFIDKPKHKLRVKKADINGVPQPASSSTIKAHGIDLSEACPDTGKLDKLAKKANYETSAKPLSYVRQPVCHRAVAHRPYLPKHRLVDRVWGQQNACDAQEPRRHCYNKYRGC